jgi:hypothetical protein
MNPYVILVGVLLFVGAVGGAYVVGRIDGRALEAGERDRQTALIAEVTAAMQETAAKAIQGIEVQHVTVRERVQTEIREKPVYRDCRNTPDGMQLINAAITGSAAEPAADRELPAATAPDR